MDTTSDFNEILGWYENFSTAWPPNRTLPNANQFWRVPFGELETCENSTGVEIPTEYKTFLLRVGEGHFTLGNNGQYVQSYANAFLGPSEITDILNKKSGSWLIYEEFIFPDEFPFFELGSSSVLVLRKNANSKSQVYFPGEKSPICESFEQFIRELSENAEFYIGRL